MGKIFISYDFDDAAKFEELTEILTGKSIAFFQPSKMRVGRSLADQLREAIGECEACIFIATHNSVNSSWCAAELGAFWGSGKDVLIYLADASLDEDQIPNQFKGSLFERNMFRVADNAKDYAQHKSALAKENSGERSVGDLSLDEFNSLIRNAIRSADARSNTWDILTESSTFFGENSGSESKPSLSTATSMLRGLLGSQLDQRPMAADTGWRYSFNAVTTTGIWIGYGLKQETHADGMLDIYKECVLLLLDEHQIIVGAALSDHVSPAHYGLGLGSWTENALAVVGEKGLGDAIPLRH